MIFYDYYADVPDDVLKQFVTSQQLGRLVTAKAPTTPGDQSEGVMAAIEAALENAILALD